MYLEKIKNFLKKLNYRAPFFLFILLMTMTAIVPRLTSMYLTTYFYMSIVIITILFTFITCKINHAREYLLLLLPFIVFELLVILSRHNEDVLLAGYQVLLFLLPVCIGFYIVTHVCFSEFYTGVLCVITLVTCITTGIGCINNPSASRTLASTETSQDVTAILYDLQNIGGFNFVYCVVLMVPFLILALKMNKLHISVFLGIIAILIFLLIQVEYTFAILLVMISMLTIFFKRDMGIKQFFLTILGFLAIVLVFRVAIGTFLSNFASSLGIQQVADKISALFLGKDSVDHFDDDRGALYMKSIQMFFNHPVFGSLTGASRKTGGHSFILDNLALYGITGGIPIVLMYAGIYKTFYHPLKDQPYYAIVFWAFLQPIVLSCLNPGMWLENLCMFAPMILCTIYGKEVYLSVVPPKPTPEIPVNVLRRKD